MTDGFDRLPGREAETIADFWNGVALPLSDGFAVLDVPARRCEYGLLGHLL
jgi:hypothetical protein